MFCFQVLVCGREGTVRTTLYVVRAYLVPAVCHVTILSFSGQTVRQFRKLNNSNHCLVSFLSYTAEPRLRRNPSIRPVSSPLLIRTFLYPLLSPPPPQNKKQNKKQKHCGVICALMKNFVNATTSSLTM